MEVSAVEAAVTVGAAAWADLVAAGSVAAAKVEAAVSESPEPHLGFPACSHCSAASFPEFPACFRYSADKCPVVSSLEFPAYSRCRAAESLEGDS